MNKELIYMFIVFDTNNANNFRSNLLSGYKHHMSFFNNNSIFNFWIWRMFKKFFNSLFCKILRNIFIKCLFNHFYNFIKILFIFNFLYAKFNLILLFLLFLILLLLHLKQLICNFLKYFLLFFYIKFYNLV